MEISLIIPSKNPFTNLHNYIKNFSNTYIAWFWEGEYLIYRWVDYYFTDIDSKSRKRVITIPETWQKIEEDFDKEVEK